MIIANIGLGSRMRLGMLGLGLMLGSAALAQDGGKDAGTTTGDVDTPKPLSDDDKALLSREGYQLELHPSDGIEKFLPASAGANGIPETVQGVWWVTVTPLPFLLADLGGETSWDPETRTAVQKLYGTGSFTFHNDDSGTSAYVTFIRDHMQFVYRFSKDFKLATIAPAFEFLGMRVELPTSLLRYQMRWVEDGHFVRESWFFGQRAPDYQLRRIVKADGTHDADYAAYLLNADQYSYVAVRN